MTNADDGGNGYETENDQAGEPDVELAEEAIFETATRWPPGFTCLVVDPDRARAQVSAAWLTGLGARSVAVCGSASAARERLRKDNIRDLGVVELALPDGSGLDVVRAMRASGWPRVIVQAARADLTAIKAALGVGAVGVLLSVKNPRFPAGALASRLTGAIPAPRAPGGPPPGAPQAGPGMGHGGPLGGFGAPRSGFPGQPSVSVLTGAPLADPRQSAMLSGRELDVLRRVADGLSNKEIGEQLQLSALTVKSHLARIARKVGTGDRAEMVAVAMRNGLIE